MPNFFETSNNIGAGIRFIFSGPGDSYTVLPGVTVATTDLSPAIDFGFHANTTTVIAGTVVTGLSLGLLGARSDVTIAPGGQLVSLHEIASFGALTFLNLNLPGSFVNNGALTAIRSWGVVSYSEGFSMTNAGTIDAMSGVLLGLNDATGARLVNSGAIRAGVAWDSSVDESYHNGVMIVGTDARVVNLAGGVIAATGDTGAGVRFGGPSFGWNVTGGRLENAGEIASLRAWGVDAVWADPGFLRVVNRGTIAGGTGALRGHEGVDVVRNAGTMAGDVLLGGGNDIFRALGGTIDGGWFGESGDDSYIAFGDALVMQGIQGGAGNDSLVGGRLADQIFGGNDNDTLRGGEGDDELWGDAGVDFVFGGAGDDTLFGGDDGDIVQGNDGADILFGGEGGDTMRGGAGDDYADGAAGNDGITGGAGGDTLDGGTGNDEIFGGGGDDSILGGTGADTLFGGAGEDTIAGGDDADRIEGGTGDDALSGEAGNDTLRGGAGEDVLTGGAGADQMFGGTGRDTFVFASAAEIGLAAGARDFVVDFEVGLDKLDLVLIDANTLIAGNQAFTYIGGAAFSNVAGQLRWNAASGLLSGDTNGDGIADFNLQLTAGLALTAADILP